MTIPTEQAFELYLHDIQDLPLLTPEEEQQLFERLDAGRAAATRLRAEPSLPPEERAHLEAVAAEGELQNSHSGKIEIIAQAFDIGRNHAQIFGDNR
mgnify:CR=1 FL=1